MLGRSFSDHVALGYAIAGLAWVLVGDTLANRLFGSDVAAYEAFGLAKGFLFVAVTALALRWLLYRELRRRSEAEQAKEKAVERLETLLEQTVEALSHTVGTRDPYTAGHEERVAALAVVIARRMGLSEDRVEAIRVGALLHDIGKIAIPAEILSKPGRLSIDEFNLVKGHVRAGRDIVEKIDFEPAIHAVVAQHHERLDGSGYPLGLKGDEIVPEARIVAVADVVEAMISHRPYRPGLGREAALAEISAQRGTQLDREAVDACLAVFADGTSPLSG